jgi:hypothetical protein
MYLEYKKGKNIVGESLARKSWTKFRRVGKGDSKGLLGNL